MKLPIKVLLGILAAVSVAGLVFFGLSVKAKDDATFYLANGIEVTPIEVKPDDALMLLDAKVWKFDVALPDREKPYYYKLTAYKRGKPAVIVGGIDVAPGPGEMPSHSQMTIAMMPLGSGNFDEASQVKYSIRVYGAGSEGVFANPLKGCHSYTAESQVYQADSLIFLMNGMKTNAMYGDGRWNDVNIMLTIQPSTMTITK